MRFTVLVAGFVVLLSSISVSAGGYEDHPKYEPFIAEMIKEHNYDEKVLRDVLSQAERKDKILEAISRPAEKVKPWHEYRDIFLTESRAKAGKAFLKEHKATFDAVEEKYGIPREVIAAIIGVETYYGRITGSYRVIDALATLGFDYPKRSLFYRELKNYFLMVRDNDLDPLTIKGSYAGAMGLGQFIPSSYISYAVDFDGDGKKDLWTNVDDAIASVAYYFKRHGWQAGEPVASSVTLYNAEADKFANTGLSLNATVSEWKTRGVNTPKNMKDRDAALFRYDLEEGQDYWLVYKNFYVITRYNRSSMYARAVSDFSEILKQP
ncbi:lytic murein transglycosylase B [Pseudomonas sp. HK3]|jgi:membrane-bound lytic murein transglycosylase B